MLSSQKKLINENSFGNVDINTQHYGMQNIGREFLKQLLKIINKNNQQKIERSISKIFNQ